MVYNWIIMKINQISVFLEDSAKRLGELTTVLAAEGIDIQAISLTNTADLGILRLIVNKSDEALKILHNAGFTARASEVAALELIDSPGNLAGVLELFDKTGVHVEHLYTARTGMAGKAVVIFKLRDHQEGLKVLAENGLTLVENL